MRVLVSGSTGLIGSALVPYLDACGHDVIRLLRTDAPQDDASWYPERNRIDLPKDISIDAVIHLAGANIAEKRWTNRRKALIHDSRVDGTRLLVQALTELNPIPKTLLSASAIGIHGDRGDDLVDEDSEPGNGFLPDICKQWEIETYPAKHAGIRVANLRTGLVLSSNGGMLGRMLPPFRFGFGATIGSGTQYMSWIAIDDVIYAINHILTHDTFVGPVNLVSPNPVDNHEFAKTLAMVLHRPAIFRVPSFCVRVLFGEMGDKLLLSSTRVHPSRLVASEFQFSYSQLEDALCHSFTTS